MKKAFAVCLAVMLLLGGHAWAHTQEAKIPSEEMVTVDELIGYCDGLLAEALTQQAVAAAEAPAGGFCFDYGTFRLYSPDALLTENSRVTAADVQLGAPLAWALRDVGPGSNLEELLTAYPLDNQTLAGTYEEATLYISGLLPGTVNTGYLLREGSRVQWVEHKIYTADAEMAECCSVDYDLENNVVVGVHIVLGKTEQTLDEAQETLEFLGALQEIGEYSAYRGQTPAPLAREDLSFGRIDFLSAGAEDALKALGPVESDTWETDGDGFLRIMQWPGAEAIFRYDGQKQPEGLRLLRVFGADLEGPRGMRVDDDLESVMRLFPREREAGLLYGDGQSAPFGLCEITADGAYVVYAAQAGEESVLLTLNFLRDRLVEMICTY